MKTLNIKSIVNFRKHRAVNFAIEDVDSLPSEEELGRIVRMGGFLYIYGSDGWKRCGNDIVDSLDIVASDTVPSSRLIKELSDANETAHAGFGTRLNTIDSEISRVEARLDEKTDKVMAIPNWDSTAIYEKGATVVMGGIIYISQIEDNEGHDPSSETESGIYWDRVRGGGGTDYDSVNRVIGDGIHSTFIIRHGLGTFNFVYAIRTNDEHREYVDAVVQALTVNTARVTFSFVPDPNSIVVILGMSGINGTQMIIDGDIMEFAFPNPSDTWEIYHEFESYALVQTYDTNGKEVLGNVVQTEQGHATVQFNEPIAGTAVVAGGKRADVTEYHFATPSDVWTMKPRKGRYVIVQTYASNGQLILGSIFQDHDEGTVSIQFTEPIAGTAVIY